MKLTALLLTSLACCVAAAMPASSSAWQPVTEQELTPMMKAYSPELTLEMPLYAFGTIYIGDMFVECLDTELWFRYTEGSENFMYNGQVHLDTGYCSPERENASTLDPCDLIAVSLQGSMSANGNSSTDEIVIANGPSFGFQFEGLSCPVHDDSFYVNIPDQDSCRPSYNDSIGRITFNQLQCLEIQEPISDFLRDGDPVKIEGLFDVYDPVDPFPYME